ncbi:MAG: GtrA family protein [Nitrosomonadales bacterium]|nr:GtrA family protein [Nitrosomonadales bacterium]
MKTHIKRGFHSEFFRFLLVGGSNTLLGYALYYLLLDFIPYLYAYTLSYCIGIVFSYVMNSRFVFRQPMSLARFLQFPVVYVIQYGLGVAILWLLVGRMSISPELAMLGVVAATIPVTFLTSRFILKR